MKTLYVGGTIRSHAPVALPIPPTPVPRQLSTTTTTTAVATTRLTFFWINLDQSKDRYTRMTSQFEARKIRNQRVDAINGLRTPLTAYLGFPESRARAHKAEIATTLSHLKAIHAFVQTGEDVGIITEDDMTFEYEQRWPYTLDSLISEAPEGWEVLQLGLTLSSPSGWEHFKLENKRYVTRQFFWYSALAYAITRKRALELMNQYKIAIDAPFKSQLTGNPMKLQSEWIVIGTGEHRYTVYPPAFTYPMDNNSFIHAQHLKAHRTAKEQSDKAYATLFYPQAI